eukprot:7887003-Ditylum_brightwellii.AAC.1
MAEWTEWLANGLPPWAAIRAIIACCLVALDKCSGTRPVGIREILCRLFNKLVIQATGNDAKIACSNLQLCAGTEAGIEGAVHVVQQRRERRRAKAQREKEAATAQQAPEEGGVEEEEESCTAEEGTAKDSPLGKSMLTLDEHGPGDPMEDKGDQEAAEQEAEAAEGATLILGDRPSGTMLVDARNGFNKLSCMAMLWTVQHRWPKGARFPVQLLPPLGHTSDPAARAGSGLPPQQGG